MAAKKPAKSKPPADSSTKKKATGGKPVDMGYVRTGVRSENRYTSAVPGSSNPRIRRQRQIADLNVRSRQMSDKVDRLGEKMKSLEMKGGLSPAYSDTLAQIFASKAARKSIKNAAAAARVKYTKRGTTSGPARTKGGGPVETRTNMKKKGSQQAAKKK